MGLVMKVRAGKYHATARKRSARYRRRSIRKEGRRSFLARRKLVVLRWQRNKPELYLLQAARNRARRFHIKFELRAQDILPLPKFCPVLGMKLRYGGGCQLALRNSASLDRKNNARGYVPGNVIVVSRRANCLKSDATIEELNLVARFYARQQ